MIVSLGEDEKLENVFFYILSVNLLDVNQRSISMIFPIFEILLFLSGQPASPVKRTVGYRLQVCDVCNAICSLCTRKNREKTTGQMVDQNGGKFESLLKIFRLCLQRCTVRRHGDSYDMKLPFFC